MIVTIASNKLMACHCHAYRELSHIERAPNLSVVPRMEPIRVHNRETVLGLWLKADRAERARLWYNRHGWQLFWVLWIVGKIIGCATFSVDYMPEVFIFSDIACAIPYIIESQFLKPVLLLKLFCTLQIWFFLFQAAVFCVMLCDLYNWALYRTTFVFCSTFLGLVSAINLDAHPVHTRSFHMKLSFPIGIVSLMFMTYCVFRDVPQSNIRSFTICIFTYGNKSLFLSSGVVLLAFLLKNIYLTWRDPHCTVMIKSRCQIRGKEPKLDDVTTHFEIEGRSNQLSYRNSLTVPVIKPADIFIPQANCRN